MPAGDVLNLPRYSRKQRDGRE